MKVCDSIGLSGVEGKEKWGESRDKVPYKYVTNTQDIVTYYMDKHFDVMIKCRL
jgi:hypothetical protein